MYVYLCVFVWYMHNTSVTTSINVIDLCFLHRWAPVCTIYHHCNCVYSRAVSMWNLCVYIIGAFGQARLQCAMLAIRVLVNAKIHTLFDSSSKVCPSIGIITEVDDRITSIRTEAHFSKHDTHVFFWLSINFFRFHDSIDSFE